MHKEEIKKDGERDVLHLFLLFVFCWSFGFAKFRSRLKKFLPPSYSKRIYIRGTQKDLYRNGQYIELQFLTPKAPREPFKIMLKRDGAYTLLCGAKKWEYSEEISKFWGIYKKERMMSKKAKEDSEKTEENEK